MGEGLLVKSQYYQKLNRLFNTVAMLVSIPLLATCGKFSVLLIPRFNCRFRGTFRMENEDGTMFDCRIPPFSLDGKHDPSSQNANT